MPPAAVDQLIFLALAILAAAAVVGWIHRPAPRVLIPHEGRILPVVAASTVMAVSLAALFAASQPWQTGIAAAAFILGAGFVVHTSVRWDSFSAVATQAAATWTTFGAWMFGTDFVHAYSTGGAFWQPWNSALFQLELIVAAFFALLQVVAIRGARTHARHGSWIRGTGRAAAPRATGTSATTLAH